MTEKTMNEAIEPIDWANLSDSELRLLAERGNTPEIVVAAKAEQARRRKVCSLCGKTYTGHGNNPAPCLLPDGTAAQGPCCDECHMKCVMPARIRQAQEGK